MERTRPTRRAVAVATNAGTKMVEWPTRALCPSTRQTSSSHRSRRTPHRSCLHASYFTRGKSVQASVVSTTLMLPNLQPSTPPPAGAKDGPNLRSFVRPTPLLARSYKETAAEEAAAAAHRESTKPKNAMVYEDGRVANASVVCKDAPDFFKGPFENNAGHFEHIRQKEVVGADFVKQRSACRAGRAAASPCCDATHAREPCANR